nr:uncharacterized protein LOC111109424 isoform X2 [Crassostrea virginica]
MGPCTDQFKDVLCSYVAPASFPDIIEREKSRLLPSLTEPQRKLILPNSGVYVANYDDMDISLLYILLRDVCKIQAHKWGWGNTPDSADRSVSANIERIMLARNHCGCIIGGMSNTEFNQVWSEIKAAVVDLDNYIETRKRYEEKVDFVRNDPMDPVRDKHFRDQLLEQMKEIKNTRKEVHKLKRKNEGNDEHVKKKTQKLESSHQRIERNISLNKKDATKPTTGDSRRMPTYSQPTAIDPLSDSECQEAVRQSFVYLRKQLTFKDIQDELIQKTYFPIEKWRNIGL